MQNKAIFLDRDGVVNNDTGHYYIYKPDDFVFNKDIIEVLSILKKNNFLTILITNQGGIAKKKYSFNDVELVHKKMQDELLQNNAEFTDIYYCPHHSDIEKCLCRKPDSLMIEKAIAKYNIDITKSYFIGDKQTDIEAGEKAGLKSFKIEKNTSILSIIKKIIYE